MMEKARVGRKEHLTNWTVDERCPDALILEFLKIQRREIEIWPQHLQLQPHTALPWSGMLLHNLKTVGQLVLQGSALSIKLSGH